MTASRRVLGVAMSNHDRAACLVEDGAIVAATAEERLDRRKRSDGFYGQAPRDAILPPLRSIACLLRDAGLALDDLDLIVCGRSRRSGAKEALLAHLPIDERRVIEPAPPSHHLAHAYSAYATAPWRPAAALVIDERGHDGAEGYEAASWFAGEDDALRPLRRFLAGPEELSLGMLYNAFAAIVGLGEAGKPAPGKLMALSSYGSPRPDWPRLVDPNGDTALGTTSLPAVDELLELAGVAPASCFEGARVSELDDLLAKYPPISWRTPLAADLARKAQEELERGVLRHAVELFAATPHSNLAYAGGVALNCLANSRLREAGWEDVFVHPAATDDGTAVGLAMYGWIEVLGEPLPRPRRFRPFTGVRHATAPAAALDRYGLAPYARRPPDLAEEVAARLDRGDVVCWFQGAGEWGPRALGARSIVADPRRPGVRERLNSRIKFREPFRPVGLSATRAGAEQIADLSSVAPGLRPYMLAVVPVTRAELPEVTHVDGTVRIQIVDPADQPLWARLIESFASLTGLAALVNTSFNTFGEPLVETPEDAVRQFLLSDADLLVVEDTALLAADVPKAAMAEAAAAALGDTPVDPLALALGVLRAGYPTAAGDLLLRAPGLPGDRRAQSRETLRLRHAVLQRAALEAGDVAAARRSAAAVLTHAGLPAEAASAAALLAESDDPRERALGSFLASIAPPGAATHFIEGLLDVPVDSP